MFRRPRRRHLALIPILVALYLTVLRPTPVRHGAPPAPPPVASANAPGASAQGFGSAVGFRNAERLAEHFAKHGREVGAASSAAYLRMAQALRDRAVGGDVLQLARPDGVTCRFDRATGCFVAFNADGTLRTFFRPGDGERYFERQAQRAGP